VNQSNLFTGSRVVIMAGKGGVGKTTLTAAAALAIARTGRRVLAVEVDGTGALGRLLGIEGPSSFPQPSPLVVDEAIRVAAIDPEPALATYLLGHGLGRLGSRLARSGMLALVATATPGIRDLVVWGRLRQLAQMPQFDVVLVDAPAAGHAITFLRTPSDMLRTARGGPIRNQAQASWDFLTSEEMVSVTLVTTPQATPVKELIETAYAIEEELSVNLGPVLINAVEPPIDVAHEVVLDGTNGEARDYLKARIDAETRNIHALSEQLALPRVELPRLDVAPSAGAGLHDLADVLGRPL